MWSRATEPSPKPDDACGERDRIVSIEAIDPSSTSNDLETATTPAHHATVRSFVHRLRFGDHSADDRFALQLRQLQALRTQASPMTSEFVLARVQEEADRRGVPLLSRSLSHIHELS